MASQKDKSADLFALTARSKNCFSHRWAPANRARIPQLQKQETTEGTTGRADGVLRRLKATTQFVVQCQRRFESVQICRCTADDAASERREFTFHNFQFQPIEQPSAEYVGDEAA
jgi:hypothetical protein